MYFVSTCSFRFFLSFVIFLVGSVVSAELEIYNASNTTKDKLIIKVKSVFIKDDPQKPKLPELKRYFVLFKIRNIFSWNFFKVVSNSRAEVQS